MPSRSRDCEVLVVGAGPAGSSAAAHAARAGLEVVLADTATFPRDKACGDGLTPRAIAELDHLGISQWATDRVRNRGLRAAGFGQELYLEWPGRNLPDHGSAVPRTVLDARIREAALAAGVSPLEGARAVEPITTADGRVAGVHFADGTEVTCRWLVVADGARSQLGTTLGRVWHRDTAYGVAARAYIDSGRSDDEWISSHLELRDSAGAILSGYGWVFPLGDGTVNVGVGTLATGRRPADLNLRTLIKEYAESQRETWQFSGDLRAVSSALLPMGGAVSGVAGCNWVLVGDAAGCVNPLNGEGIDYGLETGRLAAEVLASATRELNLETLWPGLLSERYGTSFSIARRLAGLLTVPRLLPALGPIGMRSATLMQIALRVMGNLIVPEDVDTVARAWRAAGRWSTRLDDRAPWSGSEGKVVAKQAVLQG